MSNKIYRSNLHRVLKQTAQPRYSIAYFFAPNADAKIEPIVECLGGDDKVAKFEKVVVAKYIQDREDRDKPRDDLSQRRSPGKARSAVDESMTTADNMSSPCPSFEMLSEEVSDILYKMMMSTTDSFLERTISDLSLKSVTSF